MRLSQPPCSAQAKMTRVTTMAEKTEAMTPTVSVTAKPFTGPLACQKRMAAVISVVAFASKMTVNALS